MNPVKAATNVEPFRVSVKDKSPKLFQKDNVARLPYQGAIPTRPQYHPLGSSEIPGAPIIQQAATNLTKKANIGKAVNEALTPLSLGFGAMNVASGTNSVGGELAGQVGFTMAASATNPLTSKLYDKNLSEMYKHPTLRRFGAGGIRMVGGLLGYGIGSHIMNKLMPIYKREPQVLQKQAGIGDLVNKVKSVGKNISNNILGKNFNTDPAVRQDMLSQFNKGALDNRHVLRVDTDGNNYVRRLNTVEQFIKDKIPGGDANLQKYTNLAVYGGAIGGGVYLGNSIYNSPNQATYNTRSDNMLNNQMFIDSRGNYVDPALLYKQASILQGVGNLASKAFNSVKRNTLKGVYNAKDIYRDISNNGIKNMKPINKQRLATAGKVTGGLGGAYMLGRLTAPTQNNNRGY